MLQMQLFMSISFLWAPCTHCPLHTRVALKLHNLVSTHHYCLLGCVQSVLRHILSPPVKAALIHTRCGHTHKHTHTHTHTLTHTLTHTHTHSLSLSFWNFAGRDVLQFREDGRAAESPADSAGGACCCKQKGRVSGILPLACHSIAPL